MKVIILILALGVVLAKSETSLKVVANDDISLSDVQEDGYTVSYPEGYDPSRKGSLFPLNSRIGNIGDNLWMEDREDNVDTLAIREIRVNRIDKWGYQTLVWEVNLPNKKINRIRFMNIGVERAYVQTVTAETNGGPYANATILVNQHQQMRLLVEVYTR